MVIKKGMVKLNMIKYDSHYAKYLVAGGKRIRYNI